MLPWLHRLLSRLLRLLCIWPWPRHPPHTSGPGCRMARLRAGVVLESPVLGKPLRPLLLLVEVGL